MVWNFNYDLLMDNALYSLNKLTDSGYLMRFDYTMTAGRGWEPTVDTESELIVLKLHGSLNWIRCKECGRNLLLREQKSVASLSRATLIAGIQCPKCQQNSMFSLDRVIVPPAGLKNFLDVDLKYLWRSAPLVAKILTESL